MTGAIRKAASCSNSAITPPVAHATTGPNTGSSVTPTSISTPAGTCVWTSAPDEEATRVELDLEESDIGTHIRVTESRPLAILDGRDLAIEFGAWGGGAGPVASAGGMLAGALR